MVTRISSKGRIVLPAQLRRQDCIEPGQRFEVERIATGEYRLKRIGGRRNKGLVELLLACPEKGWLEPRERTQTTAEIQTPQLG